LRIEIYPTKTGKYTLKINDEIINDKYSSALKASQKLAAYLKGQK